VDLLKRWKSAMFVDGGLFFSVALLTVLTFCLSRFVDWGTPVDDLSAQERSRMEDCVMAERELGERAFEARPECRDLFSPPMAAHVLDRP